MALKGGPRGTCDQRCQPAPCKECGKGWEGGRPDLSAGDSSLAGCWGTRFSASLLSEPEPPQGGQADGRWNLHR
jgi:hypothetical protein